MSKLTLNHLSLVDQEEEMLQRLGFEKVKSEREKISVCLLYSTFRGAKIYPQ